MSNSISKNSAPSNVSLPIQRKYIPTGGTIVGKTTPNGGYIAGALTADEQEKLVSDAINKRNGPSVIIKTVGHIDAGGSQNITGKDISQLYKIITTEMDKPSLKHGGVLITAGTDKSELLVHCLQMMIPNPTIPIILTAAMCPPGGVKSGIGTYEDGPVNLRNSELLLEHLEGKGENRILGMMEDKAYQGGNMIKKKPHGIEGTFGARTGIAPYQLQAKKSDFNFVNNSGDTETLFWSRNPKGDLRKLPQSIPHSFDNYIQKILEKFESDDELATTILTEAGQGNITKTLKALAQDHTVIGYKGVGNGNINEKKCIPVIQDLILGGRHTFVRGTSADGANVTNIGGEAKNVALFAKDFPEKDYRLTDFMVPQGAFNTKDATRIVGMINAMGVNPPHLSKEESIEVYLDNYKHYVGELTKCVNAEHPLVCAANALDMMQKKP